MNSALLGISYSSIAPEIITAITGVVIMMVDAFSKKGARKANAAISLVGLGATLFALVGLWSGTWVDVGHSYFSGMIAVDGLRIVFSLIVTIVAIISVLLAGQFLRDENLPPGEFFALLMFATCGMLMMASAGDLVMVFLGLETTSISTYILAGYRRYDLRANESSLKYFLLGSFSTAFLLYGMALTYGATGTTNIAEIRQVIGSEAIDNPQLLLIGAAMMLVGFGFKIASAPFHLWTPDVYEGAPTLVTAFMATGPKAAVFAAFLRVFTIGLNAPATGIGLELHTTWIQALAVIAALTMTVGNVIALSQTNIKRMLAYSSIAHAGYALVGFLTGDYAPVAFYLLTYAIMNLGAFAVIQVLARAGDQRTEIGDYAGIGFEVPALSFPLAVFLLSLAGIPPTGGFISKFYVFSGAWSALPGLRWLILIAIVNSIISVYYYIYPIVVMFFRPAPRAYSKPQISGGVALALIITLLGTFYLGILPNRVLGALSSPPPQAPVSAVIGGQAR
ncbi:MAG: NADH-quinone oxidoreductase subunit N [Acidobacteriota bacterium]